MEVIIKKTYSAASEDKVDIMMTLSFESGSY